MEVQCSGIVATIVTLIAGTFSDRAGNRRAFISWGLFLAGAVCTLLIYVFIPVLTKFSRQKEARDVTEN